MDDFTFAGGCRAVQALNTLFASQVGAASDPVLCFLLLLFPFFFLLLFLICYFILIVWCNSPRAATWLEYKDKLEAVLSTFCSWCLPGLAETDKAILTLFNYIFKIIICKREKWPRKSRYSSFWEFFFPLCFNLKDFQKQVKVNLYLFPKRIVISLNATWIVVCRYIDIWINVFSFKNCVIKKKIFSIFKLMLLIEHNYFMWHLFVNVLKVLCVCNACLVVKKTQRELDIKSRTVNSSTFINSLVLWQRAIGCEKNGLNQDKEILSCPKKKEKTPCILFQCFLFLCVTFHLQALK